MHIHLFQVSGLTPISSKYFANNYGADGAHAGTLITGDYFCITALNIIRIYILLCIQEMHNRGTPTKAITNTVGVCCSQCVCQCLTLPAVESK